MDGSCPEGAQPTNAVVALVELVVLELDPVDVGNIEIDLVPTNPGGMCLVLGLARTIYPIAAAVAVGSTILNRVRSSRSWWKHNWLHWNGGPTTTCGPSRGKCVGNCTGCLGLRTGCSSLRILSYCLCPTGSIPCTCPVVVVPFPCYAPWRRYP